MASRTSGNVRVTVTYRDREADYAGRVTWPGGSWVFEGLRLSPHLQRTIAVDSKRAYDEAAKAAIGFGSYDVDEIAAHAWIDEQGNAILRGYTRRSPNPRVRRRRR